MIRLTLRFYAELNGFLSPERRQVAFVHRLRERASIKVVIEALGVPHTEIDLILAAGEPVDFAYLPWDGDRIAVYPRFTRLPVTPSPGLRPPDPVPARFVLDVHLGQLATLLRLFGFDALYRNDYDDPTLARIAHDEERILLSRDRGLLKRNLVTHGCHIWEADPERQVEEVLRRFDLFAAIAPFTRCLRCNGLLEPVEKAAVHDQLAPKTRRYYDEFGRCQSCRQVYWKGSHFERMQRFIDDLLARSGNPSAGAASHDE